MPPSDCANSVILVAEDDPDDQLLAKRAAKKAGLTNPLEFVEDGVELLDYLHRRGAYTDRAGQPLPGLILLDLNMPRMSGKEVLDTLRSDDRLCQIPVVVLTTSLAEPEVLAAYRLGANSFVTKPVAFSRFVELMQSLQQYWFEIVRLPNEDAA